MKVYNKRDKMIPANAVYIGRPSIFGNPYSHMDNTIAKFKVATRQASIDAFRTYVLNKPELVQAIKLQLKGKDLVCWCAPLPCHGDFLIELANS
jgi:hypothetical protein